jgi:Fe-S-cluster containining protein
MQGTDQKQPRCVALSGIIGQRVNCDIYENRPTPCREFGVDWVNGLLTFIPADLERCTQARGAWGLPPLLDDNPISPETPEPPHRQAS